MDNHTIPLKRCTKCGKEYPATTEFFSPHSQGRYGLAPRCKPCRRDDYQQNAEYYIEYRRNNVKELREQQRRYVARHPERVSKRRREYRQRNAERLHNEWQEYYQKNHDRLVKRSNEYKRNNAEATYEYRQQNKEHYRELARNHRQSNHHLYRVYKYRRRARELALPNDFTLQDWQCALDYFNGCCAVCGKPTDNQLAIAADHWIPLSHPDCPGTIPTNIIPLCHGTGGCNNSKGKALPVDWLTERFGADKASQILKRIQEYFDSL